MSTDNATGNQTPEVTKKAKKVKGVTDDSAKKRKREQEAQQPEGEIRSVEEPDKKKLKKEKRRNHGSLEPVEDSARRVKVEGPEGASKTIHSPSKKSRGSTEHGDAVAGSPEEASKEKKKKKSRKPKSSVERIAENSTPLQSTSLNMKEEHQDTNSMAATDLENGRLRAHSSFVQETTSFYLALSPCAYNFPLEGLCAEHISPLLLTYYPPLKGVMLSYSNPRISEHPDAEQSPQVRSSREAKSVFTKSIDEYAVTYVWLTAEFTIFRPKRGTYLEGYVNLQNESILGLVCYNYFNAGIERSRLPKDWRWVGDENELESGRYDQSEQSDGYFVDGNGKRVDGRLVFRVRDFEATAGSEGNVGSINIHGTLLSKEEERGLDDDERQRALVS